MESIKTSYLIQSLNFSNKIDGSFASFDIEEARLFQNHLHERFQPHPEIFLLANINTVQLDINSPLPISLPVEHLTSNDVKFIIQRYSLRKSLAFHLITAKVGRCL